MHGFLGGLFASERAVDEDKPHPHESKDGRDRSRDNRTGIPIHSHKNRHQRHKCHISVKAVQYEVVVYLSGRLDSPWRICTAFQLHERQQTRHDKCSDQYNEVNPQRIEPAIFVANFSGQDQVASNCRTQEKISRKKRQVLLTGPKRHQAAFANQSDQQVANWSDCPADEQRHVKAVTSQKPESRQKPDRVRNVHNAPLSGLVGEGT